MKALVGLFVIHATQPVSRSGAALTQRCLDPSTLPSQLLENITFYEWLTRVSQRCVSLGFASKRVRNPITDKGPPRSSEAGRSLACPPILRGEYAMLRPSTPVLSRIDLLGQRKDDQGHW